MTASIVGTPLETNDGGGHVIASMPLGIVSGELLIIHIAYDVEGAFTTPSGWTEIHQSELVGEVALYIGYRVADGTESSTYTFEVDDSDGSLAWVFRIENHDGVNVSSSVDSGTSSSPLAPAVTTTVDDCLIINFVSMDVNNTSPFTLPDNEIYDNGNRGVSIAANYFTQVTAGSTSAKTLTANNSNGWLASTIAISPASAGNAVALASTLDFTTEVGLFTSKKMLSSINFNTTIFKHTYKNLYSIVGFSGTLLKKSMKKVEGLLGFQSNLNRQTVKSLLSELTFSSDLIKSTRKKLTNSLDLSTILVKSIPKYLDSNFNLGSSYLVKSTIKNINSSLDTSTVVVRAVQKKLTSILEFSSILSIGGALAVYISSSISFNSSLLKDSTKLVYSQIQLSSNILRKVYKETSSSLLLNGSLLKSKLTAINSSIDFNSSLFRQTNKVLSSSLLLGTTLIKKTKKAISSTLQFIATLSNNSNVQIVGSRILNISKRVYNLTLNRRKTKHD